jgi:hypothetical protein
VVAFDPLSLQQRKSTVSNYYARQSTKGYPQGSRLMGEGVRKAAIETSSKTKRMNTRFLPRFGRLEGVIPTSCFVFVLIDDSKVSYP